MSIRMRSKFLGHFSPEAILTDGDTNISVTIRFHLNNSMLKAAFNHVEVAVVEKWGAAPALSRNDTYGERHRTVGVNGGLHLPVLMVRGLLVLLIPAFQFRLTLDLVPNLPGEQLCKFFDSLGLAACYGFVQCAGGFCHFDAFCPHPYCLLAVIS